MKNWKKIVTITLICFILFGTLYTFYIWNKPRRDVTKEQGIKIKAVALFDSFTNNENAANNSFLNKSVEVTGEVTTIKTNQAGETVVYLKSTDPVFGVNCTFKQMPGKIGKGTVISFKGICTGFLNDVILNEGILTNLKDN